MDPVAPHQRLVHGRQSVRRTVSAHPPVPVPERHTHVGRDAALHVPDQGQGWGRSPSAIGAASARRTGPKGVGSADDHQRRRRCQSAQPQDLVSQQCFICDGVQGIVEAFVGAIGNDDQLWTPHRQLRPHHGLVAGGQIAQAGPDHPQVRHLDPISRPAQSDVAQGRTAPQRSDHDPLLKRTDHGIGAQHPGIGGRKIDLLADRLAPDLEPAGVRSAHAAQSDIGQLHPRLGHDFQRRVRSKGHRLDPGQADPLDRKPLRCRQRSQCGAPAGCRHLDLKRIVSSVGHARRHHAAARTAEPCLHPRAKAPGDPVPGGMAVADLDNPDQPFALTGLQPVKRLEQTVQRLRLA